MRVKIVLVIPLAMLDATGARADLAGGREMTMRPSDCSSKGIGTWMRWQGRAWRSRLEKGRFRESRRITQMVGYTGSARLRHSRCQALRASINIVKQTPSWRQSTGQKAEELGCPVFHMKRVHDLPPWPNNAILETALASCETSKVVLGAQVITFATIRSCCSTSSDSF